MGASEIDENAVLPKSVITQEMARLSEPRLRPYRLSDGGGLYLEVSPSGGKWWRFRYRFGGKPNTVSCGVFPDVSIEQARMQRDAFRALLVDGTDPSESLKQDRAKQAKLGAPMRFAIDSDGALSFCLTSRRLTLTPAETAELRAFLDATRGVA